jgi:hypothetical protein
VDALCPELRQCPVEALDHERQRFQQLLDGGQQPSPLEQVRKQERRRLVATGATEE